MPEGCWNNDGGTLRGRYDPEWALAQWVTYLIVSLDLSWSGCEEFEVGE